MSILVFNIFTKKYLDFHIMACLFSKWVVNNYGQGGGRAETHPGIFHYVDNNCFLSHNSYDVMTPLTIRVMVN